MNAGNGDTGNLCSNCVDRAQTCTWPDNPRLVNKDENDGRDDMVARLDRIEKLLQDAFPLRLSPTMERTSRSSPGSLTTVSSRDLANDTINSQPPPICLTVPQDSQAFVETRLGGLPPRQSLMPSDCQVSHPLPSANQLYSTPSLTTPLNIECRRENRSLGFCGSDSPEQARESTSIASTESVSEAAAN